MLGSLFRKMNIRRTINHSRKPLPEQKAIPICVSESLEKNINILRELLGQSNDVIMREIKIGLDKKVNAAIIFIDGLVDRDLVNRDVLTPLMFNLQLTNDDDAQSHSGLLDYIQSSVLTVGQITSPKDINGIIASVLSGHAIILVEGIAQALDIDIRGWETRAL